MPWIDDYIFEEEGRRWITLAGALHYYQVSEYLIFEAVQNHQLYFSSTPSPKDDSPTLILDEYHINGHHLLRRGYYTITMINEEFCTMNYEDMMLASHKYGILPSFQFSPTKPHDGIHCWDGDDAIKILDKVHSTDNKR